MADVDLAEFFIELKRRRVVRVALVYGAVAFAALQTADLIFPLLELPPWTVKLVLGGTIVGLPIALVLAWAYELTPDGMRRTEPANTTVPPARRSRARSLATAMVLLVCLVAGGWATYASRIPDAAARSIAVLPFSNLSADRANEYFADGIHEQVLTQLSQIADLHVISRTSVMQYKQAQRNLREIARSLSVGSVLEGSVQREGKRVRITAQLIDARRDRHLWSQSYDRDLTDVFAIQSDIAQEIAGALRAELTGQERAALATPPTRNVEAYDAYLRAKQHSGTRQELPARLELYQRAVALDSTFLLAQIGVANTLMDLREQHVQYDVTQRIADAVRRAVQLAPASAETRVLRKNSPAILTVPSPKRPWRARSSQTIPRSLRTLADDS